MATPGTDVELIAGGTEGRPAERGVWVQNMWRPKGSPNWQTRPGFGQMAQLDTTLRAGIATEWGMTKHLGSHLVQTEWGTEQIVSVFLVNARSGTDTIDSSSRWGSYYSVSIFDTSTGNHYEQVLFRHTAQNKTAAFGQFNNPRMYNWYGNYETNETYDNQSFLYGADEPFYFTLYQNNLFFGNRLTGLLCYLPTDFRESRDQTVDSTQTVDWVKGYSEDCLVTKVVPVDGVQIDALSYLTEQNFPAPVAVTTLGSRFVVASESQLLFSDENYPNAFVDGNAVNVPSQNPVVAIAEVGVNLAVFTETEMLLFQPSQGILLNPGRFTVVSRNVGCLSPRSISSVGSTIFWADTNGIYASSNGLQIEELSKPINDFFKGGITCPLNNYLTAAGVSNPVADAQPRTLYRQSDSDDISIAYSQETESLFVSYPGSNALWCYNQGGWSLWPVESTVKENGGAAVVGVQQNITNPYVMTGTREVFLVGSIETGTFTSATTRAETIYSSSYYLMQLGRGGAIDRSIYNEDQRLVYGEFKRRLAAAAGDARAYFGKPSYDAVTNKYYIPLEIVPDFSSGALQPTGISFVFGYDKTRWTPSASAILPPERFYLSVGGALTYTVNAATSTITITVNSGSALNFAKNQRNPFLLIPMTPASTTTTLLDYGFDFTIGGAAATLVSAGPITTNMSVYVWNQHYGPLHSNNDVAQPVDWAYKSQQIGIENADHIKARGIFARMVTHGAGTSPLSPNWIWGVYNTLLGADWKGWTSQVIDFSSGLVKIADKFPLRTRYKDTATSSMKYRRFNATPKYGEYLVDDEEHDTIATSDSVKGAYLSYMMFGFMRDRAEKVEIASAKAVIRQGGTRRRTGR
tara:strand:+ start:2266 stop:4848 length:2583 start_codon:yes stop_codon:yes gene_type:complete